jgi:hypothetical protein
LRAKAESSALSRLKVFSFEFDSSAFDSVAHGGQMSAGSGAL